MDFCIWVYLYIGMCLQKFYNENVQNHHIIFQKTSSLPTQYFISVIILLYLNCMSNKNAFCRFQGFSVQDISTEIFRAMQRSEQTQLIDTRSTELYQNIILKFDLLKVIHYVNIKSGCEQDKPLFKIHNPVQSTFAVQNNQTFQCTREQQFL